MAQKREINQEDLFSPGYIQKAFRRYHSPAKLAKLELCDLKVVELKRREKKRSDERTDLARSLRDVLEAALKAVSEIKEEKIETGAKFIRWQYIDKSIIKDNFAQWGVAKSEYHRTRNLAIREIIRILMEWESKAKEYIMVNSPNIFFRVPNLSEIPLIGREEVFTRIKTRLLSTTPGAVIALVGPAGIGKSMLAVRMAHDEDIKDHFYYGIFWVGLGQEAKIISKLGELCTELGATPKDISKLTNEYEFAEKIRGLIGGRRMLFVIDDVWRIEDARALKVGGRNCSYLLTTQLPKVARDFAIHNDELLPELDEADKLELAKSLAPKAFADAPMECEQLIAQASGLPLDIEIIGRNLNTVSFIGNRKRLIRQIKIMQDPKERLSILVPVSASENISSSFKDQYKSLFRSLSASYWFLEESEREMLQSLLVFPPQPNTFSEQAALEVTNGTFKSLELLADTRLIVNSGEDRYSIHQLIHEFIKTQLQIPIPFDRLIAYCIGKTSNYLVHYTELKEDEENIRVALQYSIDHSLHKNTIDLINSNYIYLESIGQYVKAGEYLDQAEQLAIKLNDDIRLVETWINQGRLQKSLGNLQEAESIFRQALGKLDRIPNRPDLRCMSLEGLGVSIVHQEGRMDDAERYLLEGLEMARSQQLKPELCNMLQNLSSINYRRGNYEQSKIFLSEAVDISDEIGYLLTKCYMLINLGGISSELGDFETAELFISESVATARNLGHQYMIAHTLTQLGGVKNSQKEFHSALDYLYESLQIAGELSNPLLILIALRNIGQAEGNLGNLKKADKNFTEALEIARRMGNGYYISTVLCEWGEVLLLRSDEKTANDYFKETVQLASNEGDKELLATGKFGLARCAELRDECLLAKKFGNESLNIYEEINHRRAGEAKEWLSNLPEC